MAEPTQSVMEIVEGRPLPPKEYCVLLRVLGRFVPEGASSSSRASSSSSSSAPATTDTLNDFYQVFSDHRFIERAYIRNAQDVISESSPHISLLKFTERLFPLIDYIREHVLDGQKKEWFLPIFVEMHVKFSAMGGRIGGEEELNILFILGSDKGGMFLSNFDISKGYHDSFFIYRFTHEGLSQVGLTNLALKFFRDAALLKMPESKFSINTAYTTDVIKMGARRGLITRYTIASELLAEKLTVSQGLKESLKRVIKVLTTSDKERDLNLKEYYKSGEPFAFEYMPFGQVVMKDAIEMERKKPSSIKYLDSIREDEHTGRHIWEQMQVSGVDPAINAILKFYVSSNVLDQGQMGIFLIFKLVSVLEQ